MTRSDRPFNVGFPRRSRTGGMIFAYMIVAMGTFVGLCSLAVDYGRVQLVKTELRRCADATAHDYMVLYQSNGQNYANTNGPQTYTSGNTPVTNGGAAPTVTVQWGYW